MPAAAPAALRAAAADLLCPVCGAVGLRALGGALRCAHGHSFDIARQGYVSLLPGRGSRHPGDDARMVAARERFLGAGWYRPLRDAVAQLAARCDPRARGLVVDVGGGTGYYLAGVLDACPGRLGVCLDTSTHALRRAARAHPRCAAIAADAWGALPVRSGGAAIVTNVFAPRGMAEIRRILAPHGVFVLAAPRPTHLRELPDLVGGIRVDPRKPERLAAALRGFEQVDGRAVAGSIELRHEDVAALTAMGPDARHLSAEQVREAVALLPERVRLTVAVDVGAYRRRAP